MTEDTLTYFPAKPPIACWLELLELLAYRSRPIRVIDLFCVHDLVEFIFDSVNTVLGSYTDKRSWTHLRYTANDPHPLNDH
jgi:hypothetical protein